MGKGKDYELEIKNEIMANTTEEVVALRPDFSGNSLYSVADVIIIWPSTMEESICGAFVELKKRSGSAGYRISIMEGSSKGDSGLDELEGLIDGTPPWGQAWVMTKFDHRESIITHADDLHVAATVEESNDYHGVRLTPSDSISMRKPELDDWPSSTAGRDDYRKLLDVVGVPDEYVHSTTFDIDAEVSRQSEADA